jgi:hypothetical protein
LKIGGAPVAAGQFSGWAPIGGEQIGGGYEVAFKNAAIGQYIVWNVDSNGNYLSNIGVVPGTNSTLQSLEPSFHQDLNGDGVVGLPPPASSAFQMVILPAITVNAPTVLPAVTVSLPASGDTVLSASAASDNFVFGPHFGNDTIVNFQPGIDQITIDHSLFATVSDLFSHAADDAHGNAVITVAADQSIKIQDISTQILQQHLSDFHIF